MGNNVGVCVVCGVFLFVVRFQGVGILFPLCGESICLVTLRRLRYMYIHVCMYDNVCMNVRMCVCMYTCVCVLV